MLRQRQKTAGSIRNGWQTGWQRRCELQQGWPSFDGSFGDSVHDRGPTRLLLDCDSRHLVDPADPFRRPRLMNGGLDPVDHPR